MSFALVCEPVIDLLYSQARQAAQCLLLMFFRIRVFYVFVEPLKNRPLGRALKLGSLPSPGISCECIPH